jgi:hypothetical protein
MTLCCDGRGREGHISGRLAFTTLISHSTASIAVSVAYSSPRAAEQSFEINMAGFFNSAIDMGGK